MATVKGKVKGAGEEQFELLLVLIDALEEPSDLVCFEHSYTEVRTLPTPYYLFWCYGRRYHSFHCRKIVSIFVF
jgi:hypothetical protein